ncbi:MAG: glucoamylase family protein [Candidatus Omnitrophota bacterium]|nr:glucoamylase family protein [Candidatus Omnitrophota bacterium]
MNKHSKNIVTILFFGLILSTPPQSYAQNNKVANYRFIAPIIVCNYNDGTLTNSLGGISGGKETLPGTLYATVISDEAWTRGAYGYSLGLDYNVENLGEYAFYWMKLGREIQGKDKATATLDLTKYNYLSFWVKGARDGGNIKIELHQDIDSNGIFEFGKDITSYVYANGYLKSGTITKEWQKVVIPLKYFTKITDWSRMIELVLVFENKTGNDRGTVYVDDIMFGGRPPDALEARAAKGIKPPVESSFTVNGSGAGRCLAFPGATTLAIKAEDIKENPFIESVRFEYSVDKGAGWKTIGYDYDVSKKVYKTGWRPDNARDLYNYQIRAVASGIKGDEKATGILIECGVKPITDDEFLNLVERKAFEFFKDHQHPVTGLFADTSGGGDASIASTGFGLAALCIGVERGWIDKKEARARVLTALNTFLPKKGELEPAAEGKYGFFYHFLNPHTAKRGGKSEISTVDTAILVAGALTAGEYFARDVKAKAEEIYKRVEWDKFLCAKKGGWYNCYSMGWSPERGFLESYWDYYTDEVVLITLLAIGSPTHPATPDVFYAWMRNKDSYKTGKPFIYSWHGSLFSYQYANIWFDFRGIVDRQGVNWFENSTNATLANRQFCIDNAEKFKGFGPNMWGITSMARPEGYTMHFGVPPTGNGEPENDDTISPTGPAGSIVFTPLLSLAALKYMYINYPRLWGQYGFRDSINVEHNWYAPIYYGIGEAMVLLPIETFRTGFIWKNFMKSAYVKSALTRAGFEKVKKGAQK